MLFSPFPGLSVSVLDHRATQETYDSCLLPVNSFGDDEEPSMSSESDEDVIKQFEISVSRSQSFRTGAPHQGKTAELEQKTKRKHLLSVHQEDSAEGSACEGIHCSMLLPSLDQGRSVVKMLVNNLHTYLRIQSGKRINYETGERVQKE